MNTKTMNEEVLKATRTLILGEISGKCKCQHETSCELNAYLWDQYNKLMPEQEQPK